MVEESQEPRVETAKSVIMNLGNNLLLS